jgi:signal transduction histidine kinase
LKLGPRARSGGRNSVIIILVIAAIAGSLSFVSYEYADSVSNGIVHSSVDSTNVSAQIEVSEVDHLFVDQIGIIGRNLQSLSISQPVQTSNVSSATPLFIAAQNSTSEMTDSYFWIAANGNLMVARNDTGNVPPTVGVNLTSRPFFVAAEQTGMPYYGDVSLSLQLVPEVVISQPIFTLSVVHGQSVKTFQGVVGTTIELSTLGKFLDSELNPALKASLGAIDPKGVVLYVQNQSLLGQSVFGPQFQSSLSSGFKTQFNSFLTDSLTGSAGVYDIDYNSTRTSIAYEPMLINGTDGQTTSTFFGVLYITSVDVLAGDQAAQIDSLRLFFAVSVVAIGTAGLVSALVVLRWNSSLDNLIRKRTADLIAANDELAAQAKAQKDLINIAAHELRTPAQTILASSELLKDALGLPLGAKQSAPATTGTASVQALASAPARPISDDEVRDLVDSTYRNAERLQKLTKNLLEVARIDTKTAHVELEDFDLNDRIADFVRDFTKVLDVTKNGPRPKIEFLPEGDIRVHADRIKTYEVVSNLLSNAIRHSKSGGTITITAERSGGYALVKIKDQGTGIDKQLIGKLFERFATDSGTGLGLYISRNYVEAQGGKIWAENNDVDADDKGATFSFTIPLAE